MATPPRGYIDFNSNNNHQKRCTPRTPPPRDASSHAAMSVLVTRVDLYDSGFIPDQTSKPFVLDSPLPPVMPYFFHPAAAADRSSVAICRIPPAAPASTTTTTQYMNMNMVDNTTPSPNPAITKYWNQRRRLFSKFDQGIQLDAEGWFSVTPEQIAHYVADATVKLYQQPVVLLDAFCGCGGNAIAFAAHNMRVIAVDVDRHKLRKAAHNAALYNISPDNLILIECNVLFVLEYCYKAGQFVLDEPVASPEQATALMNAMPPAVATEIYEGYQIGGIDLLPRSIDVIFMDPPWGGVDYEVFGKHGYDLRHNMKIQRPAVASSIPDDFFDSFGATAANNNNNRNRQERRAQFNCTVDNSNCVNGIELLQLAAAATPHVLYDVPRNTRRHSVGEAAVAAGYRGNCLWEEHYLNARLKTVTVYFGRDWSFLAK